jgi:hypothetical protein
MRIIAIDTGSHGAISVSENGNHIFTQKLDGADPGKWFPQLETLFKDTHAIDTVVIEKPPYFMGTMIPSSRIAVLFECYGMMVGYLYAKGVRNRLVTVAPQDWQRFIRDELGIKRGEMKHADWKRQLSQYAKERFKGEGVTGQTADSRLMLDWWQRHGSKNKHYTK